MAGKYRKTEMTFINPYNFVQVDWNKTERKEDTFGPLSGSIHCRLITKTPIAIPDSAKVEEDPSVSRHKIYPFMTNPAGQYMIPGSSLRGAIRSVYETATDSCFVTSMERQPITKRAGMKECAKPYLLVRVKKNDKDDAWELHEAERYLIIVDDDQYEPFNKVPFNRGYVRWNKEDLSSHSYGEIVKFTPGKLYKSQKKDKITGETRHVPIAKVIRSIGKSGDKIEGYLYIGEVPETDDNGDPQTNKHFESVFREKDNSRPVSVSEKQMDAFKTSLSVYNDPSVNRCLNDNRKNFYEGLLVLIRSGGTNIPVWYNAATKQISAASIGRVTFEKSMGEIIGEKKPCAGSKVCRACALFGTAKDEAARGSRIRITDAVLSDSGTEDPLIRKVTLKELSGPKMSYLPFYVNKGKNSDSWSYDNDNNTPNGRKFYWHNQKDDSYRAAASLKNEGKTERNATMDLLKAERELEFDVFFDRITREQLEELKWTITLGDNRPDSSFCYKIGHGKPVGLGSVKLIIDEVYIRSFSLTDDSYQVKPETFVTPSVNPANGVMNLPDSMKNNAGNILDMLTIMNIHAAKNKNISYPFIENAVENDNNTAPHKWFSTNWQPGRSAEQEWKPVSSALNESFCAYAYEVKKRELILGEQYKGTVTGANDQGSSLFVRLDEGFRASVFFKNIKEKKVAYGRVLTEYPKGKEVVLTYKGMEDNRQKWEL